MAPIAILTLNPALDLSTTTERVEPTRKLRCGPPRYDPGGGGINVARVINTLGGEATAVYPAGGPTGEMLRSSLDKLGVTQRVVHIAGATRQNFTIDESATGEQYRFVLPGPDLSKQELDECFRTVATLHPLPDILVVSGGFPPGAAAADVSSEIAKLAEVLNAKLVLDTSLAMRDAAPGAYLMKPNLNELSHMVGRQIEGRADQIAAARSLVRDGRAEIVVLSLGADGALLVTKTVAEHFVAPNVPIHSAVGAGDSMVGAIVFALARGWPLREAVRYGVVAGAATLMTPGTELCRRADVERLFHGSASDAASEHRD